jgi:hypothetical protein
VRPIDVACVDPPARVRSSELIPILVQSSVTSGQQYVISGRNDRRLVSIFLDAGRSSDFEVVAHVDDLAGLIAHALAIAPQQPLNSHERCPGRPEPREVV